MAVRQIENLIALLEYFAERQEPATLADIARDFGWPRSSAHNILITLSYAGYLYEPKARGGYYPSSRWTQLGQAFSDGEPLPEALRNIIVDLGKRTGETAWISAPSGLYAVFLAVVESLAAVRYAAQVGNRVPIHITASGQALMSQMPERDREILLRKASYGNWGRNAARSIEEVRQQMAEAAERGWFKSASYFSPDLGGVAVPIVLGSRVFSVTVAGPIYRMEDRFAPYAEEIYAAIARELGADHCARTLKGIRLP
ncbi:IclR family transcriptional regulator [Notoacmeibacter ruber]|uniref:IclR family transcriptional regulator n=1 Tax=Notoacmeibacter ruber TaxID=2670375 RepID=A0A3L7J3V5_9HYPH|nr:IclR family transcriptional regulator [Notoacmeibacter ruber]RLQ85263.1 IclR family transcriptional regulator [Notoacmeibacter ruber]